MASVYIHRKEFFSAAHKLYNPNWTLAQNEEAFGPCANENWHGHNFVLEVVLKGKPDPDTGFVYDLKKLGKMIKELVLDKVDHKNLNLDVDFLKGQMTSTENFAIGIWNILAPEIEKTAGAKLHKIRLEETMKNAVEYFGD